MRLPGLTLGELQPLPRLDGLVATAAVQTATAAVQPMETEPELLTFHEARQILTSRDSLPPVSASNRLKQLASVCARHFCSVVVYFKTRVHEFTWVDLDGVVCAKRGVCVGGYVC